MLAVSLTRRFKNRNLSIIVTIIMIMAMFPSIAFAASATDIANHWAKVQVGDWMDKGLVNGYPDGTFKPDNNITRAEFMVIVNGAFGYKEKATVDYKDVTADAWYADAVAKAKAAGYFTGYADGTAKPDSPISRQETAVVIMKVKGLTQNESAAAEFTDAAGISQWSKGAIGATVTAGFMNGYPDGSFKANNPITRAEAVVALSKATIKPAPTPEIPADDSIVYDKAGTYGPATGSVTVTGNVTIKAKDVILQNTIIEGDLTIDKAVGDGNVTLKKVVVKGNTYINGGGTNSVYLIDTQTGKTYVIKDNGPVRIVASGTSDINQLIAQSSVKVEETDLTGKGFEGIIVDKKVDGKIEINLVNAKVDNFQVKTEGVTVNTDNNTTISTLVADAKVDVTGKGTVQHATVNASGVTFETKPTTQTVATGVTEPTVNKPSTSGGGGGGGSSTVAVSAISVSPETMALIVGETGTITATVSPDNASNKKVNWSSSNEAAATVANGVVTAKEAGTATITATSAANSSKKASCVVTVEAEVLGSIARDPGNTGGELDVTIEGNTVTFTSGKIAWYPADEALDRTAGHRVGVEITAPADFDTKDTKVTIGDKEYTWEEITDGDNFFWWYPLITADKKEFTATVAWTENSTQVFTVVVGENVTLEEAPEARAALDAVNNAASADAMKTAIENNAEVLGLSIGEGTDYAKLIPGRDRSVSVDLVHEGNRGSGYTVDSLKSTFDAIVATRLATQASMDHVNAATTTVENLGISWVTDLLAQFKAADEVYDYHSGILLTDKISSLQDLVDRYNALGSDNQAAVLGKIIEKRNSEANGQFARSQATTDALAAALAEVEATINARLAITGVSVVDNKDYASTAAQGGTVRVLGYSVGINLDVENEGKKVSDTTSIVVKLYKGENLLGQQIFSDAGYNKYGDKSAISGTIDAGGEYAATSWDNSWSAGIADIPDKAVATVQYDDGTATAEKALSFTEEQTNIFSAAQAVHALFEDVFADELVLANGVTEADINAASALVEAVANTSENKTVLEELIQKAGTLLVEGQETGQENIQMMQAPIMNAEDPLAEEPLETEDEIEVAPEEANGNDEMTTEAIVENEANEEETIVEVDEAQAEEDEEVAVEAENAEDTSEEIQE